MAKDKNTKVDNPTDTASVQNDDDARRGPAATVPNVRYRSGYEPGDVAKETLYQREADGKIVNTTEQRNDADGFRGTVVVQEGDTVTAGAARLLAEQ